jgi:hypothetical protein
MEVCIVVERFSGYVIATSAVPIMLTIWLSVIIFYLPPGDLEARLGERQMGVHARQPDRKTSGRRWRGQTTTWHERRNEENVNDVCEQRLLSGCLPSRYLKLDSLLASGVLSSALFNPHIHCRNFLGGFKLHSAFNGVRL